MSVLVFGKQAAFVSTSAGLWRWHALGVGDVYMAPETGAALTITGITVGTQASPTSIAFTLSGSFSASPLTLQQFQAYLSSGLLVRTSYQGSKNSSPQWPISEFDKAGLSSGEQVLTI